MGFSLPPPPLPASGWTPPIRRISHSTLWKCLSLGCHLGRLHTAGSAVSPTLTEPRQRAVLGSGLWKLCVQKWMIVQPSLRVKRDHGEESQCIHPWHPNFSLDEILTRDPFLLVFWQTKYMINMKATSSLGVKHELNDRMSSLFPTLK